MPIAYVLKTENGSITCETFTDGTRCSKLLHYVMQRFSYLNKSAQTQNTGGFIKANYGTVTI